jgi:flagellar biosynthetic protein FliO
MMKRFVLWSALVLGSAGALAAQTATPAAPRAVTSPSPAPLPDEKTLTITDAAGQNAAPAPAADITVWDFVKMVFILALVIGLILGFVWFMRRIQGQGSAADSPIKVLHSQTLGGSRSLQVVEIGSDILLLGVSDSGVTVVKDLTGSETADAFRLAASQRALKKTAFSDLLNGFLGSKPKIRPDVGEPADNSADFLKKQRERLKNL